jgi:hypothetical protein
MRGNPTPGVLRDPQQASSSLRAMTLGKEGNVGAFIKKLSILWTTPWRTVQSKVSFNTNGMLARPWHVPRVNK